MTDPAGLPKRITPIFPVVDLDVSFAFYRRLGFSTRRYEPGGYGFITLDGVELHLGVVPEVVSPSSAYLYVEDADELASRWTAPDIAVHPPQDTPWGMHEGAVVDPDGNVIRFGNPA
jgi:catechol 2,3-dioxygenase-like lactoylglutathione lyase family enzyme